LESLKDCFEILLIVGLIFPNSGFLIGNFVDPFSTLCSTVLAQTLIPNENI